MAREVFLDTAYAIALSSRTDAFHSKALKIAKQLKVDGAKLVTTRAVLLEIGNALASQRFRAGAIKLLDALENDPNVGIVPLAEPLYTQALALYKERPDKEWGLVDCLSFVVMHERKISDALTADAHFQQAGYKALLRE